MPSVLSQLAQNVIFANLDMNLQENENAKRFNAKWIIVSNVHPIAEEVVWSANRNMNFQMILKNVKK